MINDITNKYLEIQQNSKSGITSFSLPCSTLFHRAPRLHIPSLVIEELQDIFESTDQKRYRRRLEETEFETPSSFKAGENHNRGQEEEERFV